MPSDFSIALEIGSGADRPVRRPRPPPPVDPRVRGHLRRHRRLHRAHHPPHLGRPGHRLHLRHVRAGVPGVRRRWPASRHRTDGHRHDPTDQRLPRHAPLRRRGDLGRQRRAGLRHVAPGAQHRLPHRRLAMGAGDGTQGQQLGDRQLRRRRQRDLRGVGAVQHGRPAAPARHRRAGRGPGARQLGGAGIARRARSRRDRAPRGRAQAEPLPGARGFRLRPRPLRAGVGARHVQPS